MSYNWPEILKRKSDKELYKIYRKESMLPEFVSELAKVELDQRGFDFEHIEHHKAAWKLSRLIEEDNDIEGGFRSHRFRHISWLKFFQIIIANILLLLFAFYFVFDNLGLKHIINIFIITTILVIVSTIINNRLAIMMDKKMEKRHEKINKLKDYLDNDELLKKSGPIIKEIARNRNKESKQRKYLRNYSIIFFLIVFIGILLKILFG